MKQQKDGSPVISRDYWQGSADARREISMALEKLVDWSYEAPQGGRAELEASAGASEAVRQMVRSRIRAEVALEIPEGAPISRESEYECLVATLVNWSIQLARSADARQSLAQERRPGRPRRAKTNPFMKFASLASLVDKPSKKVRGRPPAFAVDDEDELLEWFDLAARTGKTQKAAALEVVLYQLRKESKHTTGDRPAEMAEALARRVRAIRQQRKNAR